MSNQKIDQDLRKIEHECSGDRTAYRRAIRDLFRESDQDDWKHIRYELRQRELDEK